MKIRENSKETARKKARENTRVFSFKTDCFLPQIYEQTCEKLQSNAFKMNEKKGEIYEVIRNLSF